MDGCVIPKGPLFSSALNATLACVSALFKKKKKSAFFLYFLYVIDGMVLSLVLSLSC